MTTTAARVAGLLAPARDTDTPDAELVRQFVADMDNSAFGALVRRHGPMVFGVCRRVLRDWHLAEDAFQAAFLVLARKADAITPPGAVAGWLHGVAYRVSKDARRSALRRFARERSVEVLPDTAAPVCNSADSDLAEVIDAELQKLPAKYRELLVACDLEGQARQPVAESLGIPEGTLSSRLTTARKMLADRLAKRGIAPAIVAAITAGGSVVEACEVPRVLAASTARIGSDVAGTVPAHVATLATGAIRAMSLRTLLPYAAGLVAVLAAIGLGAWAATANHSPPMSPSPLPAVVAAADPAPAPDPGRLLIMREPGEWSRIAPDGKLEIQVFGAAGRKSVVAARLSPDGMYAVCNELRQAGGKEQFGRAGNTAMTIHHGMGKPAAPAELGVKGQSACWSADGKKLVVVEGEQGKERVLRTNWVYDIDTKEKQKIDAANSDAIRDWSPDGTFFLAVRHMLGDAKPVVSAVILDRKGKLLRTLAESAEEFIEARLSPDGEWALVVQPATPQAGKPALPRNILLVVPVGKGKVIRVTDLPENGTVTTACWSPDGKKIAFTWQQVFENPAKVEECESFLIISDRDGRNQQTVTSMKERGAGAAVRRGLGVYDWKAPIREPAKEPAAAGGPNRILLLRDGKITLLDPDGKNEKAVVTERELFRPVEAKLSPDGKRVAVRIKEQTPDDPVPGARERYWLYVRDLDEKEPGTSLDVYAQTFAWSADGTEIAYTDVVWAKEGGKDRFVHGVVKVAAKEKTPLKLPESHAIIDWSRDGKYFLTQRVTDRDMPTIHLMNRDGTEHKRLTDEKEVSFGGRLSPDGKRLLYARVLPPNPADGPGVFGKLEVHVLDVATGKSVAAGGVPEGGEPVGLCWSPDGKRVAYVWREVAKFANGKLEDKEYERRLVVCDPDGKNAKTLATWKAKGLQTTDREMIDWR